MVESSKAMKLVSKIILSFFSSAIALWAATYFVPGFELSFDLKPFLTVIVVFTALNVFLRPILKLIMSPVIILTLGLGIILVNALVLYLLDFVLVEITINGLSALLYATLIISVINVLIHFSAKNLKD
jgi:putative membrane protein